MKSEAAQDGCYGPDATPYDLGDNPLRSQFDYTIVDGQRTHLSETFYFDDDGLSSTPDAAKTTTYDWDYDANDRLISETIDHHDDTLDRTEHFVMDLFGNRLSRTVDYVDPLATDQAFAYTYDDNDRLISETLDTGNDGTVDQTTTYDWGQDDTVTPALLGGTQQLGKTVQDSSSNTVSTQTFSYNLQGRLASVVSTPSSGSATKVDYQYDSSGIRISSKQFTDSNANGQFEAGELDETVEYLIDHRNHTGYAQTIVETTKDSSDVITKRIAYTFGTDEITQTVTDYIAGVAQTPKVHTFGHDAHGSVRVLLDAAGAIAQAFTYAAYGELLAIHNATGASVTDANSPGLADDAKSSLLYSGEAFDSRIGQQYLRARWYDATAGRFSRLDPYFGNHQEPLSFNKFLYVHSNPVAGIDPTGNNMFTSMVSMGIQVGMRAGKHLISRQAIKGALGGAAFSAISSSLAQESGTGDVAIATFTGMLFGAGFGALASYSQVAAMVGGASLMTVMAPFIYASVRDDWERGNHAKAVFDAGSVIVAAPFLFSRMATLAIAAGRSSTASISIYTRAAALMAYSRMARNPIGFLNARGQLPVVSAGAYDSIAGHSAGGLSGQSAGALPASWHPKLQSALSEAHAIWVKSGRIGTEPGNCAEWRSLNALAWKMGASFRLGKHIKVQAIGTGQWQEKFPVLESVEACRNCKNFLGSLVTLLSPGS